MNLQQPEASRAAAIVIDRVSKRYSRQAAVTGVSMVVAPGESVVIAGINGAGKTTLLRCLLDFTQPDEGTIEVFGLDSRRPQAREALTFLPERFMPPAHLTGRETLQWLCGLRNRPYDDASARRALDRLEFPDQSFTKPVRQYSKGMTQKLGLASVMLLGKQLWVLDEPMSGLDPQARKFVAGVLQQARQAGTSLILTSHSLAGVQDLCDQLAVMHAGRLRFYGPPQALCATHQTEDLEAAFLACIGCPS